MKYLLDYRVWLFSLFIISFVGAVVFGSEFWTAVLLLECFIMAFYSYGHSEEMK